MYYVHGTKKNSCNRKKNNVKALAFTYIRPLMFSNSLIGLYILQNFHAGSLVKSTEIAAWGKFLSHELTLMSFVALEIRSERNAPKNGEPKLNSPTRQCSSTPVGFGLVFLSTEQCDNIGASPILYRPGCSSFLPVLSTEMNIEETALLCFYRHN